MESIAIQQIVSECASSRGGKVTRVWLKKYKNLTVAEVDAFFQECINKGFIDGEGNVLHSANGGHPVPSNAAEISTSAGAATSASATTAAEMPTGPSNDKNVTGPAPSNPPPRSPCDVPNGVQEIQIADINLDQEVQPRCQGVRPQVVKDYAEKMELGVVFPSVVVFRSQRGLILGDGFHRVEAAKRAGRTSIQADVRVGEQREAVLFALQANLTHGVPLTLKEKRAVALRLLQDPEWGQWSGEDIARRSGVSPSTVSRLRRNLDSATDRVKTRKCRGRDGKTRMMKTGNIGRKNAAERPGANDEASSHNLADIIDNVVNALDVLLDWEEHATLAEVDPKVLQQLCDKLSEASELISDRAVATLAMAV